MHRPFLSSILALGLCCAAPLASAPGHAMSPVAAPVAAPVETISLKDLVRLAKRGDPVAARMLGDRFERGNGVSRDYKIAAKWYLRAAKKGDVIAQRNLGYLHETRLLGEEDYAEAEKWYKLAAEHGDPEAQRSLAYLYENGLAGTGDLAQAAMWRDRAAGRKTSEPTVEINRLRDRLAAADTVRPATAPAVAPRDDTLSPASLAETLADRAREETRPPIDIGLAFNRNQPYAKEGDSHAQYRLGMIYLTGQGVAQNHDKARMWLNRSAERGYARAQAALGALYANGIGAQKDIVQAYFWFKLAERRLPPGRTQTMAVNFRQQAEQQMTAEQKLQAQQIARDWNAEVLPAMASR